MTAEVSVFPDMSAVLVKHLRAKLVALGDTVHVATKVPSDRPDRLVRVSRTGGVLRWLNRASAQMTFECWDVDDIAAEHLAGRVEAIVAAMPREDEIAGAVIYSYSELSEPTFFPDPDTRLPRFQLSGTLDIKGKVLA